MSSDNKLIKGDMTTNKMYLNKNINPPNCIINDSLSTIHLILVDPASNGYLDIIQYSRESGPWR